MFVITDAEGGLKFLVYGVRTSSGYNKNFEYILKYNLTPIYITDNIIIKSYNLI